VAAGRNNPSDEQVETALKTGPYGRCVFQCDNDVVDHQVVSMEFEGGVTVIFSMSSFTPDISRSIKIMGTKGQIKGHSSNNTLIITDFATRSEREIDISSEGGHGGGDVGVMAAFCDYLRGVAMGDRISDAEISARNHMLCFAAEASRLNGGVVVDMGEFLA
jgi:predicted dehydrogenase